MLPSTSVDKLRLTTKNLLQQIHVAGDFAECFRLSRWQLCFNRQYPIWAAQPQAASGVELHFPLRVAEPLPYHRLYCRNR